MECAISTSWTYVPSSAPFNLIQEAETCLTLSEGTPQDTIQLGFGETLEMPFTPDSVFENTNPQFCPITSCELKQ